MPQQTAHGWPYAEDSDAVRGWPAVSKQLADRLEQQEGLSERGVWSGTGDSAGRFTIPHTMGVKPTWVQLTIVAEASGAFQVCASDQQTNASHVVGWCYRPDGSPQAGYIKVYWSAGT